jgi:multiple sugar transport system ATP-binding protein
MRSEFKLLHKRLVNEGTGLGTFIFVTHDQVEALTLGTRIVVMNKGKIVQIATPKDLYYHPNHIFVATFVGSPEMNVFSGLLKRKENKQSVVEFSGVSVPTGENGAKVLGLNKGDSLPITLGVRPESVRLGEVGRPDSFDVRVISIEPLGQANLVVLDVNGQLFTCLVDPTMRLEEDTLMGATFDTEMVFFFDPQTGVNLLNGK